MVNKLTTRQRVFIEEYLQCGVGSEAARRAGYSVKTAQEQASQLLSKLIVKQAIERRISELKATTDEVLLRLASQSRANIDYFLDGNSLIDLDKARAAGKMHLVKKIKQHTTRISKSDGEDIEYHDSELELYDAQAATVQLGKLLGMYVERVEIHDWRKELETNGIDASAAFERLVAAIAASPQQDDAGSGGGSETTHDAG